MNYYMAIGCARAGMTSCAVDYLRMALNEGYTTPRKIAARHDFAGIRGVPEFEHLLECRERSSKTFLNFRNLIAGIRWAALQSSVLFCGGN